MVTTTDASGRKGRSFTNALGQLIRVDEPDYQGGLTAVPQSSPSPTPTPTPGGGPIGGCLESEQPCAENLTGNDYPMHSTYYKYNAPGKLVEVIQGEQHRYFKYDSLGRLIRVKQPEQEVNAALNLTDSFNPSGQWTAGFTYDVLGNVLTATDAKGVTITNTYDKASRVKTRSYSDGTPPVSYFYDGKGLSSPQSPNYGKGKLTKVASSVSETRYTLFDNLGRLTQSQQITDGQTYTSSYQYNLSGALVQQTYPSGRVIKNEFESDGDLMRVFGKANANAQEQTYVNSFSYTAAGGISQMKLGNGKWETAKFNDRLQLTELGLGNSATDASLWKAAYEYGEFDANGAIVASKNTGNIARQTISFTGLTQPFVQSYRYDSLYRLVEAQEKSGTQTNWSQQFAYDRYGNRTAIAQDVAGLINNQTPAVNPASNRFNSGYGYDKNGNITQDVKDAQTRNFIFNGDNKQTEIRNGTTLLARYYYDGEGKRVKKIEYDQYGVEKEVTIFVYSAGNLVAEYSTQISPTPQTKYLTEDHLGTPRVITDNLGNLIARRDFMPFGEELFNGVGARAESLKYGATADDVRQKFTGYQKDGETGLDFAEARMYENRHGRFTAVDPLLASGKSANPQTFNRYVYAGDNPIIRTDSTGKDWEKQSCGKKCERPRWVLKARENRRWKSPIYVESGTGLIIVLHPRTKQAIGFRDLKRANAQYNEWYGNPETTTSQSNSGGVNPNGQALIREMGVRGPALLNVTKVLSIPVAIAALPVTGPVAAVAATSSHGAIQVGVGLGVGSSLLAMPPTACAGNNPCGGGLSPELSRQLGDIYTRYPKTSFDCDCAAQETLNAFRNAGMDGKIVELQTGLDIILDAKGNTIAESGFHQAVQVGDRFYDALTGTQGATWEEYQQLFQTDRFHPLRLAPPRPFIPRQQ